LKATVTLVVAAAPLLNVGHSAPVGSLRYTNSRVMSLDKYGWLLQDYASGSTLASGAADGSGSIDLAGNTAIALSTRGIEVLSATNGQLLATIPGTFSWSQLASDGSYIATGSSTALTAWSTAGKVLATIAGDYSKAAVFSAPGQIQIALGPSGQNVIQTIAVPGGTSTVSPAFQGMFNSWFTDGSSFFTNTIDVYWIYSKAGAQQDVKQLTPTGLLIGQGKWFTTLGSNAASIDIYKVGASAAPAFTTAIQDPSSVVPSGMTLGIFGDDPSQLIVIDLSGATPVSSTYTLPALYDYPTSFAAASASSWIVGNRNGLVFDGASLSGQPRSFTLGQVTSIAAGTTYVAVATASGQILYFDATTDAALGTIDFPSSQLAMSADGKVLAAYATPPQNSLSYYSLPAGTPMGAAPQTEISSAGGGCGGEVISVPSPYAIAASPLEISPNGTLTAVPNSAGLGSTTIYTDGTLTTAVNGYAVGWLDNARLLVENFQFEDMVPEPYYAGTTIFSPSGTNLGSAPIPQIQCFQVVSSDSIYSPQTQTIFSVTTGTTTWVSPDDSNDIPGTVSLGAVSGTQVIFPVGNLVLAQPY
jgi:hypothetical protein